MNSALRPRAAALRWCGWVMFGQWLFAMLLGLRYGGDTGLPSEPLGQLYFFSSLAGHFASLVLVCNLILGWPLLLLAPRARWPRYWVAAYSAIGLVLLLADTFVYQQYRFHINGMVIDLLLHGEGQVISFSRGMMWQIGALVTALVTLSVGLTLLLTRLLPRLRHGKWLVALALICLLIAHGMYAWASAVNYTPVTQQQARFPLYLPLTANKLMVKLGVVSAAELKSRKVSLGNENSDFNYPLHPLQCQRPTKPLNIMLVVIDTLRADMLTADIMPNLHALSAEGWNFTDHHSASNSTRAGIFSLFYGIPPNYWFSALASQKPAALITALQQQNYQLGIFASALLTEPAFDKTVFASVPKLRVRTPGDSAAERDIRITEEWQQWLAKRDPQQPFFGFLFYDAPHGYSTPTNYPNPFQPDWKEVNQMELGPDFDKTPYLNRYRNAVHFVDEQLQRVMADLQAKGLRENTVVIITADHGEEFNDNGLNYWGHNGNFTAPQTHVPLLILWPNEKPRQHDGLTSHYDITPTLLQQALGCHNPSADYSIGHNLVNPVHQEWILMGSYGENALYQKDRITLVDKTGRLSVRDAGYKPLPDSELPRAKLMPMLELMRRYFKTHE